MLVLGIDSGTAITGYGLVEEQRDGSLLWITHGVISTPAKTPMPERLVILYRGMTELLKNYTPQMAAVEKLFFQKNVTNAISVGQARGVALLALAEAGLDIGEYTPNEIKQSVAGYGNADKKQVQHMVRALLALDDIPKPDDAADGLAVAICHLHHSKAANSYADYQ